MRIAFANGKGGVGKTTSSLLFAAALAQVGRRVFIEDRDVQHRNATALAPNLGLSTVADNLADVHILDTAPRLDDAATLDAYRTADLVVLVCSPSPSDLLTTTQTADLLKKVRRGPTVLLANRVEGNTRFGRMVEDLLKGFPFPALANSLSKRTSYQQAQVQGWGALGPAAREELFRVALEILSIR